MLRLIALILVSGLFAACTTTKWVVVDEYAVNENQQPRVLSEETILIPERLPDVESPILRLTAVKITEKEYDQRIKVERTVQQYRPKWGFSFITLSGAAFALTAANSPVLTDATSTQKLALNATAGALTVLAVTNLRETGTPIYTGESQFLRRTGFVTRMDTTEARVSGSETLAEVEVLYNGEQIYINRELAFTGNAIDLNLGSFAGQLNGEFDPGSEIEVRAELNGSENRFSIPAGSFLEPYFQISEGVALVRSQPVINSQNILAELGEGSSLLFIDDFSDRWVKVEYANQEAFVEKESGFREWRSEAGGGPPVLVEFTDIPFGEIDVESSLPVLKSHNSADRAIILSNITANQSGSRQYADRDVKLFSHYMSRSLRMQEQQIINTIDDMQSDHWYEILDNCRADNGSLLVYINGFAKIERRNGTDDIILFHLREDDSEHRISLSTVMNMIALCRQEKTFVFVDLEYIETNDTGFTGIRTMQTGPQLAVANRLLREHPNSIVVFGNLPGQPSSLYSGVSADDKRHHIFPYFVAHALQQRKTRMHDLVRHLENNVDYTSRRIHDRPQVINAFGNFTLNLTD